VTGGLRLFEAGPDRPLDVAGIEEDLAALWKEASEASGENVLRACRANLVVLMPGSEKESSGESIFDAALPFIASAYPSRVLAVRVGTAQAPRALTASVTALCSPGESSRYVCCEKIQLAAGPGAEPSIPGVVLALVHGELPIILWVPREPPVEAPYFAALLRSADRLVVDSAAFSAPTAAFESLRALTDGYASPVLADIEWARLEAWRRALAIAFDADPRRRAAGGGFTRVTFLQTRRSGDGGPPGGCATAADSTRDRQVQSPDGPRITQELSTEGRLGDVGFEASASSLLLRAWIARRVEVDTFARDSVDPEPADAGAVPREWGPSRGIAGIRFEPAAGESFVVRPPAAAHPRRPRDVVELLSGQPDNPLLGVS